MKCIFSCISHVFQNNLQCDASGIGSGNNQIVSMQTNLGLAWFTGANGAKSVSTTVNVSHPGAASVTLVML